MGSVRGLTNDAGTLTDTFDYDAFGSLLTSTGATPNAYLFTGERFDPDLGFYYLRARYMDPNLGRFHTLDTYQGRKVDPQTLHKYAYAHDNPAMNIDPSGHASLAAFFGRALAFIGRTTTIYGLNVAYVRGIGTAIFNGLVQIRIQMMIRPMIPELDRLVRTIAIFNPQGASKLREVVEKLKNLVSVKSAAINVALPTILASIPGWKGGVASLVLSVYRLYALNYVAANVVKTAAEAVNTNNADFHFSFSGHIPARRIGFKAFIGYLSPTFDLMSLNDGIESLAAGNFPAATYYLTEFGDAMKRYKITGSGEFGVHAINRHASYKISKDGIVISPR